MALANIHIDLGCDGRRCGRPVLTDGYGRRPSAAFALESAATGSSRVHGPRAPAGWKVLTSATATQTGAQISTPGFATSGWLRSPTTTRARRARDRTRLLQNGTCPNVCSSRRT